MSKESLANKYRPKTWEDLVEQDELKVIIENQIKTNNIKHAYLFAGSAGVGKAQPMDSLIFTKYGYKFMKDIRLGDLLLDGTGKETFVTGIYPQGKKPVYEITFSDRTKVKCSDEHLWKVIKYKQGRKKEEVKTLLEIIEDMNKGYKFRIPIPILDIDRKETLPVDPYLLGFLIGDGSLVNSNLQISIYEEDVFNKLKNILNEYQYDLLLKSIDTSKKDYRVISLSEDNYFIKQNAHNASKCLKLKEYIRNLNLDKKSIEKHIPEEYLYSSIKNRIKLLQGLFDSDGYVSSQKGSRSSLIYNTSSPQLSEDFAFLVRSLGGTDTVVKKKAKYCKKNSKEYIECNDTYQHTIKFANEILPFSSIKHITRYKQPQNKAIRRIDKIEYMGEEECQCIRVNSEDHTYITNNLTVTHNTTSCRIIANKLNNGQGAPIELDCASHNSAEDARAIVEECRTRPLAGKYKIFLLDEVHMFSQTAWNVLLKILEEPPEYVIFLFATTDPQKIIGTIMSRVQRYNLTRISTKGIISRLTYILNKENVTSYEIQAIEYIARLAKGGMRDAITSLEKCLDYDNNLTLVNVQKVMSNGLDEDTLFSFMKLMLDNNSKEALNYFYKVYMKGVDTTLFLKLYTTYIENCVKYLILKDEYNVELSELTLNWLKENDTFFEDLRVQLLSLINIKNNYSSEDLRIIIESWIIQSCIS